MTLSKRVINLIVLIALAIIGLILFLVYMNTAERQNKELSIPTMIQEYTKGKTDVKLTIGVLKDGKTNFKVFGVDSKELEPVEYEYEIGSISKTFTASILCKAIANGRIDLNQPISKYLPLDSDTFYPTVLSLAIHTSGYGDSRSAHLSYQRQNLKRLIMTFIKIK